MEIQGGLVSMFQMDHVRDSVLEAHIFCLTGDEAEQIANLA